MSAQQLADRCAELGMPIARSVLANLESGRRESVSAAEIMILAQALDVPPVLLMFPLGRVEAIEYLPGQQMPPWDAMMWFSGRHGVEIVRLYERHSNLVEQWKLRHRGLRHAETIRERQTHEALLIEAEVLSAAQEAVSEVTDEPSRNAQLLREWVEETELLIRSIRRQMLEHGLILPELPPELSYIDADREGT
jgi:transcriptional regulator with XRE-family HTH domain